MISYHYLLALTIFNHIVLISVQGVPVLSCFQGFIGISFLRGIFDHNYFNQRLPLVDPSCDFLYINQPNFFAVRRHVVRNRLPEPYLH